LFALVATALTRARSDMFSPALLAQVLVPTVLVAFAASTALISATGLASVGRWALAGVLVPIGAVSGFFSPFLLGPGGGLFLMFVAAGSAIAVPVGVVGHLLLRYLISRWHYSAGAAS